MSKEKGPPRPGARPRPSGRSPSGTHRAARPTAKRVTPADAKPTQPTPKSEPKKPSGEALEMIPLGQDAPADNAGDGATTFFARPKPKGASVSGERTAEPPKLQGYRPPVSGAAPPPVTGGAPVGIPVARPPIGGGSMGIQGPVASGPIASGPTVANASGGKILAPDGNTQRTRSFRLYAFVLLICTGLAGSLVVGVAMIFMYTQNSDSAQQLVEAAPKPSPSRQSRANADTVKQEKPVATPRPSPRPKPRPAAAPRPSPRPQVASAPAPAPTPKPRPAPATPSASGKVTLKFSSAPSFLRAEMSCPGGGRQRKSFSGTRVTFDNVAASGCTVTFKGGAAHSAIPLVGGRDMTCEERAGLPECR